MIIFLHGVPETAAVWDGVRLAIERESVALALPGFGNPRPEGFGATMDEYVDWILSKLNDIADPIDLVGHDWGAAFTYRIATAFGHRLHSWAADIGNIVHPSYEWHDIAKLWQTPGEGEAFVAGQAEAPPEERAPLFEAMGVPPDKALQMAEASDATMGGCILDLYRSATPNPHHHWGPWAATTAPGLVLNPTDDPVGDATMAAEVATALGARFELLDGAGHFWPYQAPAQAAELLESFWASVP
ncbi:MAG: alpha/beta hydrolase [Acidimicrobiia bacterium]|nr:alpha/beta hydrolase [Acidimicrobiia bacterium]